MSLVLFAVAASNKSAIEKAQDKCDRAYDAAYYAAIKAKKSASEARYSAAQLWLNQLPTLDTIENIRTYIALVAIGMADPRDILRNSKRIGEMMFTAQTAMGIASLRLKEERLNEQREGRKTRRVDGRRKRGSVDLAAGDGTEGKHGGGKSTVLAYVQTEGEAETKPGSEVGVGERVA